MGIKTKIEDGSGTGKQACVDSNQNLHVINAGYPGENPPNLIRPFRQHLTDDGLPTDGTNQDMRVNGSTTPVNFYIPAASGADRYIATLVFTIADSGASLNQFGSISALTNGCHLFYEDPSLGDVTINDQLTTNYSFIQLSGAAAHGIGNGASSYRANNVSGNSEGFIMTLDFRKQFGLPWGIRLANNTNLRLVLQVRDDITGVDLFDAVAYGYDRILP